MSPKAKLVHHTAKIAIFRLGEAERGLIGFRSELD